MSGAPDNGDDGLTAIIDGGCGVVECCGVQATVTFDATTVRWPGFAIGSHEPDDRVYVFDRVASDAAVDGIASLTPTPWHDKE